MSAAVDGTLGRDESVIAQLQPDDRRHEEATRLGGRRGGEHLVAIEAVEFEVLAHHVGDRRRMGHRLDAVEIERVDVVEMVEHVAQLGGRQLQFLGVQRQTSELGDLGHGLGGDAVRHRCEATDLDGWLVVCAWSRE